MAIRWKRKLQECSLPCVMFLEATNVGLCDGQGGLACCDLWGRKELDTTERLN